MYKLFLLFTFIFSTFNLFALGVNGSDNEKKTFIVASSASNSIEILNFKVFNPPLHTLGAQIISDDYKGQKFDWWDTWSVIYKFDVMSYEQMVGYFTDSYKQLVPLEVYQRGRDNIDQVKSAKRTVRYYIECAYNGERFLFVGGGNGHLEEPYSEEWGVKTFKYEDSCWKWYSVEKSDCSGKNLIFLLPLSNPNKLGNLVEKKIWHDKRFINDFKNTLQNTNKLITPK